MCHINDATEIGISENSLRLDVQIWKTPDVTKLSNQDSKLFRLSLRYETERYHKVKLLSSLFFPLAFQLIA